jgi:fatty-acyl-CoA synthase
VIVAGLGADSAYLWTLPMFHCNGWCFPWPVTAVAVRHDRRCERPRHLDLT